MACGKATCDIGATECLICELKVGQYANCSIGGASGGGGGGGGSGSSKNCFVDCGRCCSVYCDQCYCAAGEQCPLCYSMTSARETPLYHSSASGVEKRTPLRALGSCLVGDTGNCIASRHHHHHHLQQQQQQQATTRSSVCLPSECGRGSCGREDSQTYSSASICGHKNIYDCQPTGCGALL